MSGLNSPTGFLLGVGSLALAVRLFVGFALLSGGPSAFVLASDDGDAYDGMARSQTFGTPVALTERMAQKWHLAVAESDAIAGSGRVDVDGRWPPAYWLLLAAQYRVLGSAYASTVVLQAALGAAGVLAGYALARRVVGERFAQVAAVGMAISSTAVYLSAALYAESLYIPLVLGGLALTLRAADAGPGARHALVALGAGMLFGLAEATRPVALAAAAVALAWLAWQRPRTVPAWLTGFIVVLAPFAVHDLLISGHLLFPLAGAAEAVGDLAGGGASLSERAAVLFIGGWAPIGEPTSMDPLMSAVLRLGEMLLALGGALVLWRKRSSRRTAWLLTATVAAVIVPPLLFGLPLTRYRAPADPLLIVWMAAAAESAFAICWRAHRPTARARHALPRGVSQ